MSSVNDVNDADKFDESGTEAEGESELSAEDLEVLRAFDAIDHWEAAPLEPPQESGTVQANEATGATSQSDDTLTPDVLQLFISEAGEDIARMRRTLTLLEQDDQIQPTRFVPIKRAAHKIRGTAGAVECVAMATCAGYAEVIVEQITGGTVFPVMGVNALAYIVTALELLLECVVREGKEPQQPLTELEAALRELGIDAHDEEEQEVEEASQEANVPSMPSEQVTAPLVFLPDITALSAPVLHIDARRVEQLTLHAESMTEQQSALVNAQEQVESALQELHSAQTRLQQLEPALSSALQEGRPMHAPPEPPMSSLIARILHESAQRNKTQQPDKLKPHSRLVKVAGSSTWDELDIEHYGERDLLVHSLREAIADVNLASSKARTAIAHLNRILNEGLAQFSSVRNDILLLRLTPLSTLVPRLRQEVMTSALAREQQVLFEVEGEGTEIDQNILEALASPLIQLLRTCIADTAQRSPEAKEPYRIWLYARGGGNEITLEIGFSMTVQGGAVATVREPIQRLNGAISLQRNTAGGISFLLRLPRSHTTSHCLVVRVGSERVMVPFSQVQRIGDMQHERLDMLYKLHEMLDFPMDAASPASVRPVLIMQPGISRKVVGVLVDEILGEIEMVVKPLSPYLQRPGISGAAVDGGGYVLLMVDLPELISHYALFLRTAPPSLVHPRDDTEEEPSRQPTILVADDSVYFRQSLLQILKHASYNVTEARDGLEAIEQLLEHPPDVLLLDIEMPNLNGFDVLSMMHLYPELASVKVIMLTSRSSAKHRQHARDLGAHAYLTKPCPQETLLAQIEAFDL